MRVICLGTVVLLAGVVPLPAMAQQGADTPAIQDVTPTELSPRPIEDRRFIGTKQSNGDAHWLTELARQVYAACPDDTAGVMYPGSALSDAGAHPDGVCVRYRLFVRNDSKAAIQCKATVELSSPDHSGQTRLEEDHVIFPNTEEAVLHSQTDVNVKPKNYSTECVAVPQGALPPLGTPPECKPTLSGPSPDDFYPPGSRRREEQGGVALEFSVTADAIPTDVRVVGSSGFADLDTAALKYAKHLRAQGPCVGVRSRVKVRFVIAQ
jgi:TonB family protein